jgi:Ca2+-binding EF-hand superfamily protein
VLREILKELDDKITSDDLDSMIEEIDSDGSGTVDFDGELFKIYVQAFDLIIPSLMMGISTLRVFM